MVKFYVNRLDIDGEKEVFGVSLFVDITSQKLLEIINDKSLKTNYIHRINKVMGDYIRKKLIEEDE